MPVEPKADASSYKIGQKVEARVQILLKEVTNGVHQGFSVVVNKASVVVAGRLGGKSCLDEAVKMREVYSKSGGSWLPAEIIQAEPDTVKVRYMAGDQPGSPSRAWCWLKNASEVLREALAPQL